MQAKLTVYEQNEYTAWLAEAQEKANYITDKENPDMFWGWKWLTANTEVTKN
jgi:heme/copper-type cytochrome/quinol oxidase subunit 2